MERRKLKILSLYLINYSILIGSIIGLRYLHGMDLNLVYFAIVSPILFSLLVLITFIKPEHIEKIFPEGSTVSLVLILTLRFAPLIKDKIMNIKHHQEIRGARFGKFSQFKNYMSLLVPSIILIIRWADNISEGIRIRGGE